MKKVPICLLTLCGALALSAQTTNPGQRSPASKPLFRDPVHDGAADPVIVWNSGERKWFMFYTNRRANATNAPGVSWVHGTRIGIAESADGGVTWKYRGVAEIPVGEGEFSHWAPEIVAHEGRYHMFLTFVPGMHQDWSGTREIVHLTSTNLLQWKKETVLELASSRVIDACVMQMPGGRWRLWYNNEPDKKAIYYAESDDLFAWKDGGKVIGDRPGEGPKVFRWQGHYWMIVDNWQGLGIYRSEDAVQWTRQKALLLDQPGSGADDGTMGLHADVVVSNDRAFLFYFTHPGRRGPDAKNDGYEQRRSSIQVVELALRNGELSCDRNAPTCINLVPPDEKAESASYLFSYFIGNGEDGLHLAYSDDGYKWEALGGGRSFLKPAVGESKLMRDPCLLRGPDGTFHMVWTTSWAGKTIGYAHSKDLVEWSEQRALPVMAHEPAALNCWAPEIFLDKHQGEFLIFWATTITNRFLETAGSGDQKYNHRMYSTTTRDFVSFTPTRLFYDPGFNVIDATLLPAKGKHYLVFKDETLKPERKDLRYSVGVNPTGPFADISAPFTRNWVEGPTCLKVGDHWVVYFDCYRDHRYGAVRSRDLVAWEDVTEKLSMPGGIRHGTALEAPLNIVKRLREVAAAH